MTIITLLVKKFPRLFSASKFFNARGQADEILWEKLNASYIFFFGDFDKNSKLTIM